MLKILVDAYKDQQQLFITGSSSFRILDMTEEPLTGRKIVHYLYPLSLEEVSATIGLHMLDTHMEAILRYGLIPPFRMPRVKRRNRQYFSNSRPRSSGTSRRKMLRKVSERSIGHILGIPSRETIGMKHFRRVPNIHLHNSSGKETGDSQEKNGTIGHRLFKLHKSYHPISSQFTFFRVSRTTLLVVGLLIKVSNISLQRFSSSTSRNKGFVSSVFSSPLSQAGVVSEFRKSSFLISIHCFQRASI